MLTCKKTSHLVSEGQERELSLKERINLRLHIWMCNKCRRFERQIVQMRSIMRKDWTQDANPTDKKMPSESHDRIRKTLEKHIDSND